MAFRRSDRARRLRLLVVLFVVGGALALAAYIGLDLVFQDFERADYSKFDVALKGAGVAAAHPLVGIGRGAAAPVLAQFGDGRTWSMTPENILVCWAAEWGVLAALAVVLTLGSAARDMFRSNRTDVWCSGAALLTVFVHDFADFLLEMPGLVVVVAALLGAAATRRSRRVGRVRYHRAGAVAAALGVLVFMFSVPRIRPERLVAQLAGEEADVETLAATVARQHPLDPELALWVGHAYIRAGSPRAFAWLNHAMTLAPRWSSPHVMAANALLDLGAPRQAMLEVREAELRVQGRASEQACRLTSAALLLELAPEPKGAFIDRLQRCLSPATGQELDSLAIEQGVETARVRIRRARRATQRGELAVAREEALRARELDPESDGVRLALAEIEGALHGPAAALRALGLGEDESTRLIRMRVRLAASAGDEAQKQADLATLRARAGGAPRELAAVWALEGRLCERSNDWGAALRAYERAHRLAAGEPRHLQGVARVAERLGQVGRARAARRELCEGGHRGSCANSRPLESPPPSRQHTWPDQAGTEPP